MGHKAEGPRAMGTLLPSTRTWERGERERIRGNGISLTLQPMDEMWAGVWMSVARQVESRVPELAQHLSKVQARGPLELGL